MPPQNSIGQESASDRVHQMALALGGQGELPVEVDDSNPVPVKIMSGGGAGGGTAGTEYVEDAVAPANPVGGALIGRRRDTLSASEVSADGDMVAINATNKGELRTSDIDMLVKSEAIRALLAGVLGISAASLPLPTGAATQTTLAALLTALGSPYQAGGALPLPTNAATSGNQASELTKLDQLHTDMIAATPAGENHIGKIGGDTVVANSVPTVTSASAYATGNVVGGKLTFAGLGRVAGGTGLIQMASIHSKSLQTGAFDLVLFHSDPTASTFTDKTAITVNASDYDKVLGVIHLTDWTALGTVSFGEATQLAMAYKVATGATDIYGVLVARSAPTFASTSDFKIIVKSLLD